MNGDRLAVSTAVGRIGAGATLLAAPGPATALVGLPDGGITGRYFARLFGIRDLTIGLLTLPRRTRRTGLLAGVVVDAVDLSSGLIARREGAGPLPSAVGTAGIVPFLVGGALALLLPSGRRRASAQRQSGRRARRSRRSSLPAAL